MACSCKGRKGASSSGTYVVKLPGGLEVPKSSEPVAKAFAAKHPGAKVIKK